MNQTKLHLISVKKNFLGDIKLLKSNSLSLKKCGEYGIPIGTANNIALRIDQHIHNNSKLEIFLQFYHTAKKTDKNCLKTDNNFLAEVDFILSRFYSF